MAICEDCGRETKIATSCAFSRLILGGESLDRVFYGAEPGERAAFRGIPCHDCGVRLGGYHHFGCDWERCPRCGGQLIFCGCTEEVALIELAP